MPSTTGSLRNFFEILQSPVDGSHGKGFTMIDSGIADVAGRLKHLLAESPLAEIRRVSVDVDGDRILLSGRVRSFYAKQMAQETVRELVSSRKLALVNSLDVNEYPTIIGSDFPD